MAKVFKAIGIILLCIVLLAVLVVGGYVGYLMIKYDRIPDYTPLEVQNPQENVLQAGQEYSAVTFNIGFGAYDHDFSFFMDTGTMQDGAAVKGQSARAASKGVVQTNTTGAIGTLQQLDADFMLLQEVDKKATRSYEVDQVAAIEAAFTGYSSSYASNFHTVYLAYPFHEPIGAIESGIATLSRYSVRDALRRSYPVDESFPTKFFDLDRCFSVQWLPVEGTSAELVIINTHMSAYDEGGIIREQQLRLLLDTLEFERGKGNYVIVGGDFNHALSGSLTSFASGQQLPDWVVDFDDSALPEGFRLVTADNANEVATCRSSDMGYTKGVNYTTILDGFIVSDNIDARAWNVDADFANSDHNPVKLSFTLHAPAEEEPQDEEPQGEEEGGGEDAEPEE